MFNALTDKFSSIFSKLRGYGKITEDNIDAALKDLRMALLEADVNVKVVKTILEHIKDKCLGHRVYQGLTAYQQFISIVREELVDIMGKTVPTLKMTGLPPTILFMAGLQGSGKTTTSAKLALHLKKQGKRPYLIPADLQRPAAIDQLAGLAKKIDVPCYPTSPAQPILDVVKKGTEDAREKETTIAIVDTAGRLHVDESLMQELRGLHQSFGGQFFLVVDAMTGQDAVRVALKFGETVPLTGLILTKMDGDARGGAALSIRQVVGTPVYYMGRGEHLDDFNVFDPERLVSRILDQGDLLSLAEKARKVMSEEDGEKLKAKLNRGQLNLEDFLSQMQQMKKMGNMSSLLGMIPGGRVLSQNFNPEWAEGELKKKEAIIYSMTFKERRSPKILNGSMRLRIAQGSGTQVSDVNRLLKEFTEMEKMFKKFSKGGRGGLRSLLRI